MAGQLEVHTPTCMTPAVDYIVLYGTTVKFGEKSCDMMGPLGHVLVWAPCSKKSSRKVTFK